MNFDMEILVPVCRKLSRRTEDFKKYGLINTKGVRVLVTAISSNEDIDGLAEGWPEGVSVRVKKYESFDYVSNMYRFYAEMKSEDMDFKWIMRVDDDSCTDLGGLYERLENFYDWKEKFYLGDLSDFSEALNGGEGQVFPDYSHLLGEFKSVAKWMKNEVECGIISRAGMEHILNNDKCMNLIAQRAELRGGYTDCTIAIAAAISKFHPTQCPFVSCFPKVNEFSLFGGHINHIHMVSRTDDGYNFRGGVRCGKVQYDALIKKIEGRMTDLENLISGKKFLMETDSELIVYNFKPDRTVEIKFNETIYIWTEYEGSIFVFSEPNIIYKSFLVSDSGNLTLVEQDGKIPLKLI